MAPQEVKDEVCAAMRPQAKAAGLPDSPASCWDLFVSKVRLRGTLPAVVPPSVGTSGRSLPEFLSLCLGRIPRSVSGPTSLVRGACLATRRARAATAHARAQHNTALDATPRRQVRRNLHVVLCASPVGDRLRGWARQFPALVAATQVRRSARRPPCSAINRACIPCRPAGALVAPPGALVARCAARSSALAP